MAKNPDYMQDRLETLNTEQFFTDMQEIDGDPEQDSFTYIKNLLKSLSVMNALPDALKMISDRVPSEVQAVILRSIQEVKNKPEYIIYFYHCIYRWLTRAKMTLNGRTRNEFLDLTSTDVSFFQQAMSEIYHKLKAVMQAHFYIAAALKMIERHDSAFQCPNEYTLGNIWMNVQTEVSFYFSFYQTNPERSKSS